MRVLHIITTILWLFVVVIACNTNPSESSDNQEEEMTTENTSSEEENPSEARNENEVAATVDTEELDEAVDQPAESESTVGESFPEGLGYKGAYENYVFYVEMEGEEVQGFVRHKDEGTENPISGKMSSPFNFDAEEMSEDEAGDEMKMASIRGSLNGGSIDIDYSDANSSKSFRVTLKQ